MKAKCTWGDGPDVILVLDENRDLGGLMAYHPAEDLFIKVTMIRHSSSSNRQQRSRRILPQTMLKNL
jgi:hypothetical protein